MKEVAERLRIKRSKAWQLAHGRAGHTRECALHLLHAFRCWRTAHKEVSLALSLDSPGQQSQSLEIARGHAWLAAHYSGACGALLAVSLPGPRSGSKAAAFDALARANPGMPASRLNALLPTPMDDATARRLARKLRAAR